VTEVE